MAQRKLFDQMIKFGQTGILVTDPEAQVDFVDAVKGGTQLPHLDMLRESNNACDILILGQTDQRRFQQGRQPCVGRSA